MLGKQANGDSVFQPDRLHEGPQIVKPVRAAIKHPKDQINLGWSGHGDGGSSKIGQIFVRSSHSLPL